MRELFGWRYPSEVSGPWRSAPTCQHGHHGSARSGHRKRRLSRDVGDFVAAPSKYAVRMNRLAAIGAMIKRSPMPGGSRALRVPAIGVRSNRSRIELDGRRLFSGGRRASCGRNIRL